MAYADVGPGGPVLSEELHVHAIDLFLVLHLYDRPTLKALTDIVGIERLVIGTDYPFDMEPPDVQGMVTDVLGPPSLEVLAANARRLAGAGRVRNA